MFQLALAFVADVTVGGEEDIEPEQGQASGAGSGEEADGPSEGFAEDEEVRCRIKDYRSFIIVIEKV